MHPIVFLGYRPQPFPKLSFGAKLQAKGDFSHAVIYKNTTLYLNNDQYQEYLRLQKAIHVAGMAFQQHRSISNRWAFAIALIKRNGMLAKYLQTAQSGD